MANARLHQDSSIPFLHKAEPSLHAEQLITMSGTASGARSAVLCRLMRCCLVLICALVLPAMQGCTDLSRSSLQAMRETVRRHPHVEPTAADVAAKPYYQLQATSPDGSAVLILGNVDGQREAWYGAHHVVIFITQGRIVQTAGLSQNMQGLQLPTDDPFARGLQTVSTPVDYDISMDWSPGYRYGVKVHAHLAPAGSEEINILGTPHRVMRLDEHLAAPDADYQAVNHYWVDPDDGFVWKSEQSIAPGLALSLVQLKPYRGKKP